MDEKINCIAFHCFTGTIDMLLQLFTAEDAAWVQEQGMEQGKFPGAEEYAGLAAGGLMGRKIQGKDAITQDRYRLPALPTDYSAYTRQQLGNGKGFDQIIICTGV